MHTDHDTLALDFYALTMLQGYLEREMHETAIFEFFVRRVPRHRNFLIAAGVEQLLNELEQIRFSSEELSWLSRNRMLKASVLEWLNDFRFAGDVHAMPEGTVCFANEPILRITAPLPQAQLIEARVVNRLQFQTLIASKAIRCVLGAPEKQIVDYGLRRAHGLEAGLLAARAAYLAGFAGTSNVQAARKFDIPVFGTMAHSFVEAHDAEIGSFENYACANPENVVFILDTYDTEAAANRIVRLATTLKKRGVVVKAVRLDSGDLLQHACQVRRILDDGGLKAVRILASGGVDEYALKNLVEAGAPIDGFGIGSSVVTSQDAPALNCAYKLQEYAGRPRRKTSEGKATWPGAKQVYRVGDDNGRMLQDTICLAREESGPGQPLLEHAMSGGRRVHQPHSLKEIRNYVCRQIESLPAALRSLDDNDAYPVVTSDALARLAAELDAAQGESRSQAKNASAPGYHNASQSLEWIGGTP